MKKLTLLSIAAMALFSSLDVNADAVLRQYLDANGKTVYTTGSNGNGEAVFSVDYTSMPGYALTPYFDNQYRSIVFTPASEIGEQPVTIKADGNVPQGFKFSYDIVSDEAEAPFSAPAAAGSEGEVALPPFTGIKFKITVPKGYLPAINYCLDGDKIEGGYNDTPVEHSADASLFYMNYYTLNHKSSRDQVLQSLNGTFKNNGFVPVEGEPNTWTIVLYTDMLPGVFTVGAVKMDVARAYDCLIAPAFRKMYTGYLGDTSYGANYQWENGESFIMKEIGECLAQDVIGDPYIMEQAPAWNIYFNMTDWEDNYVWHKWVWSYAMNLVHSANLGMKLADSYTLSDTEKKHVQTQLKLIRAHAYWRLLQAYAPRWEDSDNGNAYCLPWYDTFDGQDQPLSTMNQVFAHLKADVDEAIAFLKDRQLPWPGDGQLINYQVACGIGARLALLNHDWHSVLSCSGNALTHTALYSPSTNEQLLAGYITPNSDWMWYSAPTSLIFASSHVRWSCNGYYATQTGYGTTAINKELYDSMESSDVRRRLFLLPGNPAFTGLSKLYGNSSYTRTDDVGTWYNKDAISSLRSAIATDAQNRGLGQLELPFIGYEISDYATALSGSQLKFFSAGFSYDEQLLFMRSTEMLLSEAEALCELGHDSDALRLLNTLHSVRTGNELNISGIDDIREAIRKERRLELWGEGFGWFDFKRWNMPITRTSKAGFGNAFNASTPTDAANGWRFKIPAWAVTENPLIDVTLLKYQSTTMYDPKPATAAPATAVPADIPTTASVPASLRAVNPAQQHKQAPAAALKQKTIPTFSLR